MLKLTYKKLGQNFEDRNVIPFVNYAYKVQSFNDEGNASSKFSYLTIIAPSFPCCNFTFRLFNIRSSRIDIIWTLPIKNNGLNMTYFIRVFKRIDYFRPITINNLVERTDLNIELSHNELMKSRSIENNHLTYKMNNLMPYSQYFLSMKACNRDLNDTKKFYCLDGVPELNQTSSLEKIEDLNNTVEFLTSQDRPELQPAPTLITLNSSYIAVGISRPERPNGIILLYEVWIRKIETSELYFNNSYQSISGQQLACAIEDLYDPNDIYSIVSDNKQKLCIIKNLNYYSKYILSATSSTIVGRSSPSIEVLFTTLENRPLCGPKLLSAFSYSTDSIFFKWYPTINMTEYDSYWRRCIGGNLRNFTIYQLDNSLFQIIYKGLDNSFNLTKLHSSTEYQFKIEMCNSIGCFSTEKFSVITMDPSPNPWLTNPTFTFLNSSYIYFDWKEYIPFSGNNNPNSRGRVNFRLERSEISFSYPPSPLETGIRFHGFNYFKFSSDNFFPEGYPYFGFKYSFRTSKESSLSYFAASAYDQTEFTALQMIDGKSEFLSITQSNEEECSLFLNSKKNRLNDNIWHTLKTFRIKNFGLISVENETGSVNLTTCTNNNVITDVTGV